MKILVVAQALDLSIRHLGITPAWWQIMKGLSEAGAEVIAVPYVGRAVDSLWWRTYQNPSLLQYLVYDRLENVLSLLGHKSRMDARQTTQAIVRPLVRSMALSKWPKYLRRILAKEGNVDAILVLTVPINHVNGMAAELKKHLDIPVVFYDGDTPTSLPRYGGLSLSFYKGADISDYDAFIVNSKGVVDELIEMGAREVHTVYWGVDPQVFAPAASVDTDIGVSFYGIGSRLREEWIQNMITQPSLEIGEVKFVVAGSSFGVPLGKAVFDPAVHYLNVSRRSKVCLNIVRKPHAEVFGSSISRIFELASMGCCIVSNPYNGIEEWFNVGKEVFVVHSHREATELYRELLSDDARRRSVGEAARLRVKNEHTNSHRSRQILEIIRHLM